jgi:hypothetical protein
MLDQRIDESGFSIHRANAIKPVGMVIPQLVVHERAGHQFGSIRSQTLRHFHRQTFPDQRARRTGMIEQALEELVMPFDQSRGHRSIAIQREETDYRRLRQIHPCVCRQDRSVTATPAHRTRI